MLGMGYLGSFFLGQSPSALGAISGIPFGTGAITGGTLNPSRVYTNDSIDPSTIPGGGFNPSRIYDSNFDAGEEPPTSSWPSP